MGGIDCLFEAKYRRCPTPEKEFNPRVKKLN